MYNSKSRKDVLDKIVDILKNQPAVEGIVLVGSGANGFPDDLADIDMSVAIRDSEDTRKVWLSVNKELEATLNIFRLIEVEYEKDSYLSVILLNDFLEIDVGFISFKKLVAKKKEWEVLFDRNRKVESKMENTWKNRKKADPKNAVEENAREIWYHIKNAVVSIKRNKTYRALKEIEDIRNVTVDLWGQYEQKTSKHFRDVDVMRRDFREKLERTYVISDLSINEVASVFQKTFDLYFWVVASICPESEEVKEMKSKMDQLLTELEI